MRKLVKICYPSNINLKKILFAITLSILTLSSWSQEKEVKAAIKNNNYHDYKYFVTLSTNTMIDPDKLIKWFTKNQDSYCLIDYKAEKVWFAGSERNLISSFSFVRVSDLTKYDNLQAERIRQEALESQRQAEIDNLFMAGAIVLFATTIKIASNAIDEMNSYAYSSSTPSNSSSNNSDCFKLIETTTISYNDGGDFKATGYKIKCIPPSIYSIEKIIYYNPGGSRYSEGWYNDDGGLLFQDSRTGAKKDDTFEKAAKKSCGCY